jgi:hypothetical protein
MLRRSHISASYYTNQSESAFSTMLLVSILLAALSIGLPVALAQRVLPVPVLLLNTTYGGGGCPANSVISTIDSSLLSLQFNATRYDVNLGKDISVVQNRKNCQIRAEVLVPSNYSITIWQSHVTGAAKLSEEVTAQFTTTLYLSSDPAVSIFSFNRHISAGTMPRKATSLTHNTAGHYISVESEGPSKCSIYQNG